MNRLVVLGGGSWGTALSVVLAPNFNEVCTILHNPEAASQVSAARENSRYLPGIALPENLRISAEPAQAVESASVICVVTPSRYVRAAAGCLRGRTRHDAIIVSAAKGLELETELCMSAVIADASDIPEERIVVLSGPSFAAETAAGSPTAVVVAGLLEPVLQVQQAFARPTFRVYSSEDRIGVEMGGALKNVVAIGAGMACGLGLGHNSVAALITRGLAEITRLASACGAQPRTLAGLAGLGDLVLTCTGDLSRNRQLGIALAQSASAREVLSLTTSTTEGVRTASVAVAMGKRLNVNMPIAEQMQAVLESGRSPADAIRRLMERSLREE